MPLTCFFNLKQINNTRIILNRTQLVSEVLSCFIFFPAAAAAGSETDLEWGTEVIVISWKEISICDFLQGDLVWDSQKQTLSKWFIIEVFPREIGKGSKTGEAAISGKVLLRVTDLP